MRNAFPLLFLLLFWNAGAQYKTLRDAFVLEMPINGTQSFKMEVPQKPYFVTDGALQLYPFEKLFLEVEIKKDTIFAMHVVSQNLNPKNTIEIELMQQSHNGLHENMTLSIKNPFKKPLVYTAEIYTFARRKWTPTSIMPVAPKSSGFEIWNDAILTMVLSDWAFED